MCHVLAERQRNIWKQMVDVKIRDDTLKTLRGQGAINQLVNSSSSQELLIPPSCQVTSQTSQHFGDSQVRSHITCHIVDRDTPTTINSDMQLARYIRDTQKPNVYAVLVKIQSNWNLKLLSNLCTSTSDREVVQFLTFGWPISHNDRSPVTITTKNTSIWTRAHLAFYHIIS